MNDSVLVLSPQVWSRDGGVQRHSRSLLKALAIVLPSARIKLLTLLDRSWPLPRLRLFVAALAALRFRPRLVLCTHLHLAPLALVVARLGGARLWVVCHGIEVWVPLTGLRRLALLQADLLLPVSRFTAEQVRRRLAPADPSIAVLPNTYDAQRFQPGPAPAHLLARYGLQAGQPVIFTLTRLSRGDRAKHIDRLIAAMPELRRRFPGATLLIGGDGDDRPRLQALVHQLELDQAVLLPGRLADEELPDHYRLARVFALPSEKEGFGIVFLEALGCGCAVLAGNRDGSRDPLADGRFGLLVNPDLPLADPLAQLLDQQGPHLWFQPQALSAAVADRFGFQAFCEQLSVLLRADLH